MTDLRIRDIPEPLVKRLQEHAHREHRSVSQQIIHLLSQGVDSPQRVSIMGLKGLGKRQWAGIEATQHVDDERSSWD